MVGGATSPTSSVIFAEILLTIRFCDTPYDPFNAKMGFWHSHIGWIFKEPVNGKLHLIDVRDITQDPGKGILYLD